MHPSNHGACGPELCTDTFTGRITCLGKYTARLRQQIVSVGDHSLSLMWLLGSAGQPHCPPRDGVAGIGRPTCTAWLGVTPRAWGLLTTSLKGLRDEQLAARALLTSQNTWAFSEPRFTRLPGRPPLGWSAGLAVPTDKKRVISEVT